MISSAQLPETIDAEQAALGSMILNQNCIDDVCRIISANDYRNPAHSMAFKAITDLHAAGTKIDAVVLFDELQRRGQCDEIGGEGYLMQVMNSVPHGLNFEYYAAIVARDSFRRSIGYTLGDGMRDIQDLSVEPEDIIGRVDEKLGQLMERHTSSESVELSDVLVEVFQGLDAGKKRGLSTGFADIDRITMGLQPGSLNILAARPSVGKTAMAANIALNVAKAECSVLFVSLEQSRLELAERFLSIESGVAAVRFRSGELNTGERDQAMEASNAIHTLPIIIDDTASRSVRDIAAAARIQKRRGGIGLVIVDYLQLLKPIDSRVPREQQVATSSRALKELARSLSIPVICLAQLNRAIEARTVKIPMLSDLRESGSIEQDADVVMFLDRKATYDPHADPFEAKALIKKHRNGQTGDIDLSWSPETMTFRDRMIEI